MSINDDIFLELRLITAIFVLSAIILPTSNDKASKNYNIMRLVNSVLLAMFTLNIYGQISLSDFQVGRTVFLRLKEQKNDSSGYAGTGFCILKNSSLFILTNRHMVEQRDFYTNETNKPYSYYLDCNVAVSDLIYTKTTQIRTSKDSFYVFGRLNNKPTDIVAIEISNFKNTQLIKPVDYSSTAENLKKGDEVFFISNLYQDGHYFQFFTFAKVYSYINSGYNHPGLGLIPAFLIDKPVMHGTSGSPVFVWKDKSKPPILVGIAASTTADGQGIIWKKDAISSLISQL